MSPFCEQVLLSLQQNSLPAQAAHLQNRTKRLRKQRVTMISSFYWIKKGEVEDTLALAEKITHHPHDQMHKAVGWMLREVGKLDFEAEKAFLKKHYQTLPRTSLRYAIEKFPEELRQGFLKGRI